MVDDNVYKEKIRGINTGLLSDNHDFHDFSGTYIFFSFDLVNSTFFKNKSPNWVTVFSDFFDFCKIEVKKAYPVATLWKMIGDEILFYLPIYQEDSLCNIPKCIYEIMLSSIESIHEKHEKSRGILSVKSTMWAAFLSEKSQHDEEITNVIVKEYDIDRPILDFLGSDIDIGFRISHFSAPKKLVVDAKLACLLLSQENKAGECYISEYMRIVSYECLKGVWDNRHYPIVWYQKSWDSLDKMFLYDEKFNSQIVKSLTDSKLESAENIVLLEKIYFDLNKLPEIDDLKKGIKPEKNKEIKVIPRERLSETHVVAICVDSKDEKVLIAKRSKEKVELAEKWEFGCVQLKLKQSFFDAINEGYEEDFNVKLNLSDDNELNLIGSFVFKKRNENNRKIPGIIFAIKVDPTLFVQEQINAEKHSEIKWIGIEESKLIIPEDKCVPDFHKRIEQSVLAILGKT